MMNFNDVRNYIITNLSEFGGLEFVSKDRETKDEYTAVYLIEKPSTHDLISGNGIILKFNEVGGGQVVRHFALEIRILSDDLGNNVRIRETLINMLDFFNEPCRIARYKKFRLSNEGGLYFDDVANLYVNRLFFDVKLV